MVLFSGEIIYMGYMELFHVFVFPSFENIVVQYSSTFASITTTTSHLIYSSFYSSLSHSFSYSLSIFSSGPIASNKYGDDDNDYDDDDLSCTGL